mgnify:CR=1 FL=1
MTAEEFAKLYKEVDVPEIPESWKKDLYEQLGNDGSSTFGEVDDDEVLPTKATVEDVARAIKLLASQEWYVEAVRKYLVETDDHDEFMGMPYGRAHCMLYWLSLALKLNGVSAEGQLTHMTGRLFGDTAIGAVADMGRGDSIETIYTDRIHKVLKRYNVSGV